MKGSAWVRAQLISSYLTCPQGEGQHRDGNGNGDGSRGKGQ